MTAPRHRWEARTDYRKVCVRCGMEALRRPHPYGRRWFTEWTLDGKSTNSYNGDKTPPCQPKESDEPR